MLGRFHVVLSIVRKITLKLILLLTVVIAGSIIYANLFGIPNPVIKLVLGKVNQGSFAVVVDSVVLRGVTRFHLNGVELYRNHVLGKPLFSAESLQVDFSMADWLRGKSEISAILVEGAVLIPKQAKGDQAHSEAALLKDLSFPVVVKNSRFHDLIFKQLEFHLTGTGSIIDLHDIKGAVRRDELAGRVTGEMSYDIKTDRIDGELVTHLNPHAVMTFFSEYKIPYAGKLINRFVFTGEPPRVKWVFYYYTQKNGDIYLSGDFRMRSCAYRGIGFSRADGLFSVSRLDGDVEAELSHLFVVRDEGIANVSFVAKPYETLLDFDAQSSLHPMAMARMVGVLTNVLSKNFEFNGPSTVEASGMLDYGGSHAKTDFSATIKADHVSVKRLECDSGAFDVKMQGRSVSLTNIEATAYNGTIYGSINLTKPPKDVEIMPYSLNVELHDADFEEFMKSVTSKKGEKPYHGRLSMDILIEGVTGTNFISSLNGSGAVRISDGRVFMMPVFGGLSEFMTKIIPGLDLILKQSDLKTKFKINNGLISTDKVAVEGDVLSLKAYGEYMLDGELDFDVQVKLMKEHTLGGKVFRFLTYPLSKLFEFKLKGTLDDSHWYPENFSLDLLKKIGIGKEDKK